ncbi:hypothetical protein T07_3481 [Trichinella nelsoni]|uniref:Uncharacterized protein n=1 Tax=Trichinella nelsoni TaxID=6336 RepID=A0A0V0RQ03_9BILA|nr:hypothetical protein T07_3481 [Trichinella nelsoni]
MKLLGDFFFAFFSNQLPKNNSVVEFQLRRPPSGLATTKRINHQKKMPKKTPLLPSQSCPTENFRTNLLKPVALLISQSTSTVPNKTPPHSPHTD